MTTLHDESCTHVPYTGIVYIHTWHISLQLLYTHVLYKHSHSTITYAHIHTCVHIHMYVHDYNLSSICTSNGTFLSPLCPGIVSDHWRGTALCWPTYELAHSSSFGPIEKLKAQLCSQLMCVVCISLSTVGFELSATLALLTTVKCLCWLIPSS